MVATHCPRLDRRFSFFASTPARIGAAATCCRVDRVSKKSQTPFSPRLASPTNSTPENSPNRPGHNRRNSSRIGAITNSERAFSVPIALARFAFSTSWTAHSGLAAIDGTALKRFASASASPSSSATEGKANS